MDFRLLLRPRLFMTMALKKYCRSNNKRWLQLAMRNTIRKYCVTDELIVHANPNFWIRVSPKDYATYGIYFFGDYDPSMTDVFSHLIKPGETVWDIGTERGWFTLHMAKLVGEFGRVDSFEAFPPTFQKLQANIDLPPSCVDILCDLRR